MPRLTPTIGLLIALAGGCGAVLPSRNCEWPSEPARPLDLRAAVDRWHLIDDARDAEEIAIRHADANPRRRSGRYAGAAEYAASREQCLTAMAGVIASRHGLQPAQVAEAGRPPRRSSRRPGPALLCGDLRVRRQQSGARRAQALSSRMGGGPRCSARPRPPFF